MHDFTVNYEVSGKWFFGMPNYPAKKQVKVFFWDTCYVKLTWHLEKYQLSFSKVEYHLHRTQFRQFHLDSIDQYHTSTRR